MVLVPNFFTIRSLFSFMKINFRKKFVPFIGDSFCHVIIKFGWLGFRKKIN